MSRVRMELVPERRRIAASSKEPSSRWRGSVWWPYSTAGTCQLRRARRDAPLPNSVRTAATSLFDSGMAMTSVTFRVARRETDPTAQEPEVIASITEWLGGALPRRDDPSSLTARGPRPQIATEAGATARVPPSGWRRLQAGVVR